MKKVNLFAICVMACLLVGCEPKVTEQKPTVLTLDVTEVTTHSAQVSCNVVSDGGSPVIDRGVAYDIYPNPKATGTKCKAGTGTGKYTCSLTELQDNKRYYVRAYAKNEIGIEYGKEVSFTTIKEIFPPKVSTGGITNILLTSATISGLIINDGGADITECGIVYSTSENPTILNDKVLAEIVEEKTEVFRCELTGLQEQTTYFVRAYAINEKGIAYGEERTFTTTKQIMFPTVVTTDISQITTTTAIVSGNVTSDGNADIIDRGVCIATISNPTTSNTMISAGSGMGVFSCNLDNLRPNTTYYVRAYAVNSKGTAYGENMKFKTTKQIVLPTVVTAAISQITTTTAIVSGNVTSDGNADITDRGVCIATVSNPTTSNTIISAGSGKGSFISNLDNLQPNTTYYVRAYAVNSKGIAYGDELSFKTLDEISISAATGSNNGHEYVDLGLSVKWATMNIGASKPEDFGGYYAWGETSTKTTYNRDTYIFCDYAGKITKYKERVGTHIKGDDKFILDLCDDAAHVNWGGDWLMPSPYYFDELVKYCTWTKGVLNGVFGYKVTSNKPGYTSNSIFLPAAGYRLDNSLHNADSCGYYWSRNLYSISNYYNGKCCYFNLNEIFHSYPEERLIGMPVRPVCE